MIVVIGMDPGPIPGLVRLYYSERTLIDVHVVQCSANMALDVLAGWLSNAVKGAQVFLGVEQYVDRLHGRSGPAGKRTRDMVGSALTMGLAHGACGHQRPAVKVKEWATDARLEACGLVSATKGMTHARDAARHALYTACKDALIPDPLSRKARR